MHVVYNRVQILHQLLASSFEGYESIGRPNEYNRWSIDVDLIGLTIEVPDVTDWYGLAIEVLDIATKSTEWLLNTRRVRRDCQDFLVMFSKSDLLNLYQLLQKQLSIINKHSNCFQLQPPTVVITKENWSSFIDNSFSSSFFLRTNDRLSKQFACLRRISN